MTLEAIKLTKELFSEAIEFMRKANPFAEKSCGWDTGRFMDWAWATNWSRAQENDLWFEDQCTLFYGKNVLVGMAVSEYGSDDTCIITEESDPVVAAAILKWIDAHWGPKRGELSFEFIGDQDWLIPLFEKAEYVRDPQEYTGHEWEYKTGADNCPVLPEGFTIESRAENKPDAAEGIIETVKKAFNSTTFQTGILDSLQQNPMYDPELDLYVRSPEGKIAAYCRGTVDSENGVCGIDPVCCHPDFTRKGLAKAVVKECLRRMGNKGGKLAYIGSAEIPEPSTYLYKSLGPVKRYDYICYSKKFSK